MTWRSWRQLGEATARWFSNSQRSMCGLKGCDRFNYTFDHGSHVSTSNGDGLDRDCNHWQPGLFARSGRFQHPIFGSDEETGPSIDSTSGCFGTISIGTPTSIRSRYLRTGKNRISNFEGDGKQRTTLGKRGLTFTQSSGSRVETDNLGSACWICSCAAPALSLGFSKYHNRIEHFGKRPETIRHH